MSASARDPEGRFTLQLPPGWTAAGDDDQDGLELWNEDGVGTLHLISFEPGEDFLDPAEELYAFLEQRGVELEDDEVEDLVLDGGELALCEYLSEDEEEGDSLFWLVGVAAGPDAVVFATYFCPAGEEARERELVRGALATLRLTAAAPE